MKSDLGHLSSHLFICTRERADGAACGSSGSKELLAHLKKELKVQPGCERLRVNAAGCLGRCEEGIVAVLYPQGQWFTQVSASDGDILKNAVINASDQYE